MLRSFVLIGLVACSCLGEEEKWHFRDHEFDRTKIGDAVDSVSMKLLKETYAAAADKNIISSPLGVLELLSLYSGGAGTEIKEEVVKALGATNYDELYNTYTSLSNRYSSIDPNILNVANKIFVNENSELNEEYSSRIVPAYRSEVGKVNFSNPPAAADVINRWSEEKTKGHIKDPVSPNSIHPGITALLANVIFFQGQWNIPFNSSETQEKDFHVDKTNVVKKPMMHLEQTLFYHDSTDLGAKLIELPYREKGFRMVVILPNAIDGLPAVLEKVAQKGILADVFSLEPAGRDIILDMPKFEFQSSLNLEELLPKVGVSKIFTEEATGIVKGGPVVVSQAFQKAIIKVNEEGATAGAFTGFIVLPASSDSTPPTPMEFKVDHPFLFAILHEDIILFVGTYTH